MVRNMGKFNTSDNKSIKSIYNNDTTVSSSSKSELSNEVTREEIVDLAYRVYKANGSRKPIKVATEYGEFRVLDEKGNSVEEGIIEVLNFFYKRESNKRDR
jgi:hypothetical protein